MTQTVGVIGLGAMGSRIARKLLSAGHEARVWDRDGAKRADAERHGAQACESPAAVAAGADVLLTVLTDDEAVRAVVLDTGLLASLREGAVYADLSTTSPGLAEELAAGASEAGAEFLDVAMAGSTPQVEAGELTLLVGGDERVLERVRPVLEPLAAAIHLMGPAGAGAKTKLAVNLLLGVGMQALAEAIAFGEAAGVDRDALLETLSVSAVVPPGLRPKLENVRRDEYPVTFALRLMQKDFRLLLDHAVQHGLDLPAAAASAAASAAALDDESADVDFSAVARHVGRAPIQDKGQA